MIDWAEQELQAWGDWQNGIMMPIPRVSLPSWNKIASYAARKYADDATVESPSAIAFVSSGSDDDRMMMVDQAIVKCSSTHKTVIVQRFVYGRSHSDIAKKIKTRKENIGNLIHEAVGIFAENYLKLTS